MRRSTMLVIAVSALAAQAISPVLAQEAGGKVLTGKAAFGDWRADKPGVRRLLRAQDMPAASLDESASNSPRGAERPEGGKPVLPPGFEVELVASGTSSPRVVRVAPNGDLFVAESREDQVRVYRLGEGAKPAAEDIFAADLNRPYGIAFYPPGDNP